MEKNGFNKVNIMSYTDEKGLVHSVCHTYPGNNEKCASEDAKDLLYEIFTHNVSKGE